MAIAWMRNSGSLLMHASGQGNCKYTRSSGDQGMQCPHLEAEAVQVTCLHGYPIEVSTSPSCQLFDQECKLSKPQVIIVESLNH